MDINTLAKSIVQQATGEKPLKKKPSQAAVARGKARMASMTPEEVSKHAANAANKRWTASGSSVKMKTGE
jgi:hypothetical protein